MLRFADINLQFENAHGGLTPGIDQVYGYLAKRGVSKEDIDQLGLHIVTARELIAAARGTNARQDDPRLAVVFPHFDPSGRPIDWWSARLVDAGLKVVSGFAAMTETKWGKMFCPPQEPPHAYLPPTLDWTKLSRGDKVYVHESCIKAINGARLGYWSVGLNGVWGWGSKKHEIMLVDELRALPWKALQLQPVIVFDSNAADNWDVQSAIVALSGRLYEITGQQARHILLPPSPDGTHWGFDDFCVHWGEEVAKRYLDGEGVLVETDEFQRMRVELNSRVCVVSSLSRIAEQDTGVLMNYGAFVNLNYATYITQIEDTEVNVAKSWIKWDRRSEVAELVYAPGQPRVVPGRFLNLWRGMGADPARGDVGPWLRLMEHCVEGEGLRKWMIQWFAYPLQNLGAKMTTFLHLYGPPGTGKNALLAPIVRIYGNNAVVIGKDQIASSFNSAYATRQFVNIDEIHGGNDANALAITNRVKMLTTSPKIVVNRKGEPEYEVANHINLVTTSNYSDSIKLDEGDRRACVVLFGRRDNMLGASVWDEYWRWVDNGGAEALYRYLLEVDMTGFDPNAAAPLTEWKEMVTDATRGAMEKWVRDLWDDPDSVLPPILRGSKVLTPEQVGMAYYPDEASKNTPGLRNALGQRLQDLGVQRMEVKVDGAKKRVWLIRQGISLTNDEVREELRRVKPAKY